MFNMHFNKEPGPGTGLCTNIQAGIRFKPEGEVITRVTDGEDLFIRPIAIPPGAPSYSASREYTFEEDVEILSFLPHMHLRGKAALYEVTYPDGRHETLLHVPNYDFNWQHTYRFKEPVFVPAGSVISGGSLHQSNAGGLVQAEIQALPPASGACAPLSGKDRAREQTIIRTLATGCRQ
jgi:hypothetical protein